jgi:hypothetical protein
VNQKWNDGREELWKNVPFVSKPSTVASLKDSFPAWILKQPQLVSSIALWAHELSVTSMIPNPRPARNWPKFMVTACAQI